VNDDSFDLVPPPFKPDEAMHKLRRELRELGLAEREGRFERKGVPIARAAVDGAVLQVAVVKRPSRNSPEWQPRVLKSGADQRDFVADLKRKLAAWGDRDE